MDEPYDKDIEMLDRRKNMRSRTSENAYAALGRQYCKVGKIKDISEKGLSFEYIVGEGSSEEAEEVDIFLARDGIFHLQHVRCKVIYQLDVFRPEVSNDYVNLLTIKRCGLQFEPLSDEELSKLQAFISIYGRGSALKTHECS
jgi:hypothetical protein